ncbi:short chain dehydrogenase [Caballeronia calidae]|uniref:Short chain dehydrogenase n=1 Tax=Caballeronia calidae TaxID=1777139 RepID=A0A158EIK6_9BURK|nr:short chain dehydrogenase [Caballeronia calidae]
MRGRVAGKSAFITAAAKGIGRAAVEAYLREGARVFATDVDEGALSTLEPHPQLTTNVLDVRDTEMVKYVAHRVGPVDVLFNCAGFVHQGAILDCEESDWDLAMDLNVKSMYRTMRAFLPHMLEAGGGSIINMSSAVSSLKGVPDRCAYATSKRRSEAARMLPA